MDCSLPGSSVYGISWIRIAEWVAIFFSRVLFPTQGSNPGLPHCRWMLLPSEPPGKSHPEVCLVKAMVFPSVMYGCESWAVQKAERWRIDAFELQCWRRLLRVPWTRRANQSILKEISPGCSLEGLMLKLKLQYFSHLMWRADSFEKDWRQETGTTEDEMAGCHHRLNGHRFE